MPWESRWLRWPDFWLPSEPALARQVLGEAWQRATTQRVEIACGGGVGRTGAGRPRGRLRPAALPSAGGGDDVAATLRRPLRRRTPALADLKTALEYESMSDTEFVYTTYVNTTPERLWQALTDPAFTRRYWGVTITTDWRVGSTMTWEQDGVTISDPAQVVLEAEPHRRLAYTWHSFTPEFARSVGLSDEIYAKVAAEPRSRVTFEIEPFGELVRLTIVHGGFEPGSTVVQMVSDGWPHVLSDLKTLLETGETRPADPDDPPP
jgi:uncharacterized protein YndB with AHSA1/START domain